MKKSKLDSLQDEIRRYFGFLFSKGYKFRDSRYFREESGNWFIELESPDLFVQIYCDRAEILISFSPAIDRSFRIGLKPMIYFLTGGQIFIGAFEGNLFWRKKKQFESLADLLKDYFNQISIFLGPDFYKYKSEIIAAGNNYMAQTVVDYPPKIKTKT